MITTLQAISPVFFMMVIGFIMGRSPIFPEGGGSNKSLTTYIWWVAIPALLIKLLGASTFPSREEFIIVGGYYLSLYIIYFIGYFLAGLLFSIAPKGRGIFALSCAFGNLGFIGIAIQQGTFGEEGVRILLIIMSFHLLTLLPITSVLTEISRTHGKKGWDSFKETIIENMKNPVVLTLFFGLVWSATGLGINQTVLAVIDLPASSAAPVGLFTVGLSLARVKIQSVPWDSLLPVALKLIILPVIVYLVTFHLLHLPPSWVGPAVLTACMPTGMVAYTTAESYDEGANRNAATILISTVISIVTIVVAVNLLTT